MDFGSLLNFAQKNESAAAKSHYYRARFDPPKKEQKQNSNLSSNIQKFLAQKEEEEQRKTKEIEEKRRKLLAMRDPKDKRKIEKMLKVIKSANKSVLSDTLEDETAITASGPCQPDEDDYGYESQVAADLYQKIMNKYSKMPAEEKFPSSGKGTIKDLGNTKDRVRAAIEREREIENDPHLRRLKRKEARLAQLGLDAPANDSHDEEPGDPPTSNVKEKKKRPQAPPPLDFHELLRLAEQKRHEPVNVQAAKESNDGPVPPRPMTTKERRAWQEEQERLKRRALRDMQEKKQSHKVINNQKTAVISKSTTNISDKTDSPKHFSIPKIPKKSDSQKQQTSKLTYDSEDVVSSHHLSKNSSRWEEREQISPDGRREHEKNSMDRRRERGNNLVDRRREHENDFEDGLEEQEKYSVDRLREEKKKSINRREPERNSTDKRLQPEINSSNRRNVEDKNSSNRKLKLENNSGNKQRELEKYPTDRREQERKSTNKQREPERSSTDRRREQEINQSTRRWEQENNTEDRRRKQENYSTDRQREQEKKSINKQGEPERNSTDRRHQRAINSPNRRRDQEKKSLDRWEQEKKSPDRRRVQEKSSSSRSKSSSEKLAEKYRTDRSTSESSESSLNKNRPDQFYREKMNKTKSLFDAPKSILKIASPRESIRSMEHIKTSHFTPQEKFKRKHEVLFGNKSNDQTKISYDKQQYNKYEKYGASSGKESVSNSSVKSRQDVRPDNKRDNRQDIRPQVKQDARLQVKHDARQDIRSEIKQDLRLENKRENRLEAKKGDMRLEGRQNFVRSDSKKVESNQNIRLGVKQESGSEVKSNIKPMNPHIPKSAKSSNGLQLKSDTASKPGMDFKNGFGKESNFKNAQTRESQAIQKRPEIQQGHNRPPIAKPPNGHRPMDPPPRQFPPIDTRKVKKPVKRRIDSESEKDSELDDFIDDDDDGEDYSSYIKEIFGYDKTKYRHIDEDDSNMESTFAQQMREEFISKKIGLMEDLEDMRMEAEEKKLKAMKKRPRK